MPNKTVWDALAPELPAVETAPSAWYDADNIELAEPTILQYLASHIPDPDDVQVLDFGCGNGRFAARLARRGYHVAAIDPSPNMIGAAKVLYGAHVPFTVGDADDLPDTPTYDVITAVMVLQFIPDFKPVLERMAAALNPGGILLLVVFNPLFITDWLAIGDPNYVGFDSLEHPTKGDMLFGDVKVPTYIREDTVYIAAAAKLGLSLTLEAYPPFSRAFLDKYPVDGPTVHAEHMVLGFVKDAA